MIERRCKGFTKTGDPCQRYPLKGQEYCKDHRPDSQEFDTPTNLRRLVAFSLEPAMASIALLLLFFSWKVVSSVFHNPQFAALGAIAPLMIGIGNYPSEDIEVPVHQQGGLILNSYQVSIHPNDDSWLDFLEDLLDDRDPEPHGHSYVSLTFTGQDIPPQGSSLFIILPWDGSFMPVGYQLPCNNNEKSNDPVVIIDERTWKCSSLALDELVVSKGVEVLPAVDDDLDELSYRYSILHIPSSFFSSYENGWEIVAGFTSNDYILERTGPITRSISLMYQTEYYDWGVYDWKIRDPEGKLVAGFHAIPVKSFIVFLTDQSLQVLGDPDGISDWKLSGVIKYWEQQNDEPGLVSFTNVVNEARLDWIIFSVGLLSAFAIEILINRLENIVRWLRLRLTR